MNVKIEETWKTALENEFDKPYFIALTDFVREQYNKWANGAAAIYPKPAEIFNAFNMCPYDRARVVIIGQDPYHEPGQAHGLCFSVRDGIALPPSLQNIYKEIQNDLGRESVTRGDLTKWAEQGVLLLNSTLTVQAHLAASHAGKGWEQFTDAVIKALSRQTGIVYLLWGSYAQRKAEFVNPMENLVLKSVHPSPLSASRGFFGNHHFSRANEYLAAHGKEPIEW
ncbi:MAG: uracil-DNA glycosylase [Rickettsiales bacterium]|jgi:uracil-DNA glycosylase|nr:uracil-DNA glycosylase [Rickettsiales bacterium]